MVEFKRMIPRINKLPRDHRGFPVPFFVCWVAGKPDFRVTDTHKFEKCCTHKLCWICGEPLGKYMAFVLGPMCLINRINSEPPSHKDCAEFAAINCPFLARPAMKRNEKDLPQGHLPVPGVHSSANPGLCLVYTTTYYDIFPVNNGVLLKVGEPSERPVWYCEGTTSSNDKIIKALGDGYETLKKNTFGEEGLKELDKAFSNALALV